MLLHKEVTDYERVRKQAVLLREIGGRIILVTMGVASADNHNMLAKALVVREHISTHYTLKNVVSTNKKIALALCRGW